MNSIKKIGCWFLAVLCACVGIAVDCFLVAYRKPGALSTDILAMVLFSALWWLLAYALIVGAARTRSAVSLRPIRPRSREDRRYLKNKKWNGSRK